MTFVPSDVVSVRGKVTADAWPMGDTGWMTVALNGYQVLVKASDVTLIAHKLSPGQAAYERFALESDGVFMLWADLKPSVRLRWEQVAEAARAV